MKIRPFQPSDISQVKSIHHQVFHSIQETEDSILEFIQDQNYGNFVAERDGKLMGYTIFSIRGSGLYLNWLAVLPENESKGIGSMLLKEVVAQAKKEKIKTIVLDSRNRFKRAMTLYLKNEFDIIGTFLHTDGEMIIRFSKNLETANCSTRL